ncbi:hypothetical protein Q8G39_28115, partial [Klebsiella pneumoniae]|uniref:hypothetical protein n=1 Tax=Klebsiella pneumoniae TaxID=573 RepID=UPI00301376F8
KHWSLIMKHLMPPKLATIHNKFVQFIKISSVVDVNVLWQVPKDDFFNGSDVWSKVGEYHVAKAG